MYAPAQALAMALDRRMRARSLDQEAASQDQALAGHLLSQGQQAQQGQMASEDMLERLKQQAAAAAQRAQLRSSGDIMEERIKAEALSNKIAEQERTKRGLGTGRLQLGSQTLDETKRHNLAQEDIGRGANQARMADAARPRGGNKMRPEEFRQAEAAAKAADRAYENAKRALEKLESDYRSNLIDQNAYSQKIAQYKKNVEDAARDADEKEDAWRKMAGAHKE